MALIDRLRFAGERAVDVFLLRSIEAEVAARPAATSDVLARLTRAARVRIATAEELTDDNDAVAAIALYRDAAAFLAASWVAQHENATAAPASVDAVASWGQLANAGLDAADPPAALQRSRAVLATNDLAAADALGPEAQQRARTDAADTVAWLSAHVESRSRAEVRRARYARVATLCVLSLALTGATVFAIRMPKNIARGKPVSASSRHDGTPPADGATNGTIESNYGVHTNVDDPAWIAVDLLRSETVREIRVYARGDGYENESVPLLLEVSQDGKAYVEIGRRIAPFKQADPWILHASQQAARFVRVSTPGKGYIALAEIEVYSRR